MCPSFYESDATWKEESNDGSEFSHESKGMSLSSKSKNDVSSLNIKNQIVVEIFGENSSLHYEYKEVVDECIAHNEELSSCVKRCHAVVCDCNKHVSNSRHASDSNDGIPTPIDKLEHDWWSLHFNYVNEDNAKNVDLYSTCLIGEVDDVSSCNGNSDFSSSYAESTHDANIESGSKVFSNPLYDEDIDMD